jgi:hypothetical protein
MLGIILIKTARSDRVIETLFFSISKCKQAVTNGEKNLYRKAPNGKKDFYHWDLRFAVFLLSTLHWLDCSNVLFIAPLPLCRLARSCHVIYNFKDGLWITSEIFIARPARTRALQSTAPKSIYKFFSSTTSARVSMLKWVSREKQTATRGD